MAEIKCRIYRHFLGGIFVEIDRCMGQFQTDVIKAITDEEGKFKYCDQMFSSGFMGEEFFESCTLIAVTSVDYKSRCGHPQSDGSAIGGMAIEQVFGKNLPSSARVMRQFVKTHPLPETIPQLWRGFNQGFC